MDRHPASATPVATCRRHFIAGALSVASLATMRAQAQAQSYSTAPDAPAAAPDRARTSLHQQADFRATAPQIYEALLNSRQFTAITGEPAKIDAVAGGAFSMFGGKVVGRNIELLASLRIVQAWRSEAWEPGVYSIVRFMLRNHGPQTRVLLDQAGFPDGDYDSLIAGWKAHYWDPLTRYFG
jgi:activator of HSP90 ATPase